MVFRAAAAHRGGTRADGAVWHGASLSQVRLRAYLAPAGVADRRSGRRAGGLASAAGELGAVVRPDALAPVAVAAGFTGQQIEQRAPVAGWLAGTPGVSTCLLKSELARSIGASTFSYPRIHEMLLVQLPPSMLNRSSSALSSPMTAPSRSGPSPGSKRSHARCWSSGCSGGRSSRPIPSPASSSRYSVTFTAGVGDPGHSLMTSRYSGETVHHDAAVLAVGDLGDQRREAGRPVQRAPGPGLVVGLHLAHELGIAALGLDDRDDAGRVAVGVCAHEPVRQMRAPDSAAAGLFHGVFLDQHHS